MTCERNFILTDPRGLHARPASALARIAHCADSKVEVSAGELTVDAASVISLLLLEICQGTSFILRATGDDATDALDAVEQFLSSQRIAMRTRGCPQQEHVKVLANAV